MAENRGGPRNAKVGTRLPNRKDLRAPGQPIGPSNLPQSAQYGQGVQQARALRATPAARTPTPSTSGSPSAQNVPLQPGQVPSLSDPSAFPDEPVTAGLALGPGAGPEALTVSAQDSPELAILRRLYLEYPNPDVRRMMAFLEDSLQFRG